MKKIVVLIPILFLSQIIFAQNVYQRWAMETDEIPEIISKLNPEQDSRLTNMVGWQIENSRKKNGIDGWRVEIFTSSANDMKEKSLKVKQEFLSLFPDVEVHVLFIAPNFKVRVGDFRTRNEALKLRKQILVRYPESFEVKDIIRFPELTSRE